MHNPRYPMPLMSSLRCNGPIYLNPSLFIPRVVQIMSTTVVPLKNTRLVVLNLVSILATVAACIGLNALIRSNQQKSALRARVNPPTRIVFDTAAIQNSGIVATVGNILLASIAFLAGCVTLLPPFHSLANKTVRLQAILIAFFATWVFACMIPYMVFFANDSTRITAFIGTSKLPDSVVASTVARSGHSTRYKDMWFLRLFAIFPWLAIAAALVAVPVLFKAAGQVGTPAPAPASPTDSAKESVEHKEKV